MKLGPNIHIHISLKLKRLTFSFGYPAGPSSASVTLTKGFQFWVSIPIPRIEILIYFLQNWRRSGRVAEVEGEPLQLQGESSFSSRVPRVPRDEILMYGSLRMKYAWPTPRSGPVSQSWSWPSSVPGTSSAPGTPPEEGGSIKPFNSLTLTQSCRWKQAEQATSIRLAVCQEVAASIHLAVGEEEAASISE